MARTGFIDVPNGRLYYEDDGQGQAILFIHAGVADLHMWDAQAAALAPDYRVIRFDMRSYGKSTCEAGAPYNDLHDVLAVLDHAGVERAVICGCSMGGELAVDFVLAFPERASGLVTVGGGFSGYDAELNDAEKVFIGRLEALQQAGDHAGLADAEAQLWAVGLPRPVEQGSRAVYDYVREVVYRRLVEKPAVGDPKMPDPVAQGNLHRIAVPALIIYGDQDTMATQQMGDALASTIPNARKLVIPNAAHLPNMEYPEVFNAALREFLGGLG